jgi:D-citramalate synthase
MEKKIEIMDTTLRDGEQTSGVSFLLQKANHCRPLEELNVDRIEIASAREAKGNFKSKRDKAWATKD